MTRILSIAMCTLIGSLGGAAERPNVLLIYVDDLRPQTSDYGHSQMRTPNFERLANRGIRFENAYCQVPTCGASRASLFTSLYPTRERFPDFLTWAEKDAPGAKTLPQRFKDAGYTTISNGKVFHHKQDTESVSWSEPAWRPRTNGATLYNEASREWLESSKITKRVKGGKRKKKLPMWEAGDVAPLQTHDGRIAKKTMSDLERLAAEDQPFFMVCGFAKPHMPFYSPRATYDMYPLDGVQLAPNRELPQPFPSSMRLVKEQGAYVPMTLDLQKKLEYNSTDYHRQMRQGYYASVSHADDLVGRLLDKLKTLGLEQKTYVVVIGDHGWLLGEHDQWAKNVLLHDALRTAMWMSGPGIQQGASVESFVEFVDIYPTLCELAGIEMEQDAINGRSFTTLLSTPDADHRDHAYTRFEHGDSIATQSYHYVRWTLEDGTEQAMLIDRVADPLGKNNVSGIPEYAAVESRLRDKLLAKIAEAQDIQLKNSK